MRDISPPAAFAAPHQPEYDHTQHAPLWRLVMVPPLVVFAVVALVLRDERVNYVLGLAALCVVVLTQTFRYLRVVDEGESLAVCFGPLPVLRKRISYDEILTAEPDQSKFIDGWGVHWVSGRGWTFNLWGWDCVRLTLEGGRTIRVGTDDPAGLARFLSERLRA